jgi:hypothetical protein
MDGGSFVMCEDLCCAPEPSFGGVEVVLAGATVPCGGGGNGPFCCALRVTAKKPVAIKSSALASVRLPAFLISPKVNSSISSNLLALILTVLYPRIRCIDS